MQWQNQLLALGIIKCHYQKIHGRGTAHVCLDVNPKSAVLDGFIFLTKNLLQDDLCGSFLVIGFVCVS
jgi:hypothetical protein